MFPRPYPQGGREHLWGAVLTQQRPQQGMSRTRHSHRSEVSLADDKQLPSFLLVLIRDWKGWRCTENLLSFFPKASKTQKNPHRGLNRPDSRPGVNPLPRGRWPWLEATGCEGRTIPQPLALGCVQLWLSVHQEVPTLPGEAATPPPSPALGPWPGSQGHLATEVPARKNLTRKLVPPCYRWEKSRALAPRLRIHGVDPTRGP